MAFATDSGSGSGARRPMTDINVTPLVDVMLVLLIIFMVTAPLIQSGVKVDLPRASAQQMEHSEEKLVLTITRDRRIFLGNAEISPADLETKLATNARIQKDKELYLHADRSLPYGQVVEIMATARRAGVESLGMITEPDKELRRR
jgi:biopolymer transport protein TolR